MRGLRHKYSFRYVLSHGAANAEWYITFPRYSHMLFRFLVQSEEGEDEQNSHIIATYIYDARYHANPKYYCT